MCVNEYICYGEGEYIVSLWGGGAEQSVSQQGLKHKPALSVASTCGLSQTDCTLKTAMEGDNQTSNQCYTADITLPLFTAIAKDFMGIYANAYNLA